jgi:CheY-like chemotaxis protein
VAHGPILVIEDDGDLRDSLCELLQLEGFATVSAASGREALEWLRRNGPPCAILLDLMMPVMSGPELRTALLHDPAFARIPVIVLSALEESRQRGDVAGAQAYLKKPVEPEVLVLTLKRYC